MARAAIQGLTNHALVDPGQFDDAETKPRAARGLISSGVQRK